MCKKSTAIVVILALFGLVLAGCGGNSTAGGSTAGSSVQASSVQASAASSSTAQAAPAEKATVKLFNHAIETVDWLNGFIDRFNKDNPNIQVEQEFQKDYENALKVKFASGDVPDIVTGVYQVYIDQGKYVDLSDMTDWWSRLSQPTKDASTDINTGKKFALPTILSGAGVIYNKAIFNELGLKVANTWDEFVNNLKIIKEKKPGVTPLYFGGRDSWTLGQPINYWAEGVIKQKLGAIEARKAFLGNKTEELGFDQPGSSIELFAQKMLQLKNENLINQDCLTATYDNSLDAMASGKAAMIWQGIWAVTGIMDKNKEMKDLGFSQYPALTDDTQPTVVNFASGGQFGICSASKSVDAAKTFLSTLIKPENLKPYCEAIKAPPAFTDVEADWGYIKDDFTNALKNAANVADTDVPLGFGTDDSGRMVQDLLAGKYSKPADFAKAFRTTWDKCWNATYKK